VEWIHFPPTHIIMVHLSFSNPSPGQRAVVLARQFFAPITCQSWLAGLLSNDVVE
jgi:hypothetical protein